MAFRVGCAIVCAWLATPAGASDALTNPVLGDPAAIAAGKRIYRQRCYICHLNRGGRGPNIFATKLDDERFLEIVINGRDGKMMPAFGTMMSPDEVWQVHAYVKSRDRF